MTRYAVRIHLNTHSMTPCSICVYVAYSERAAYQFIEERGYPKSYRCSVKPLPAQDTREQPSAYSVLDWWDGGLG